MSKEMKASVQWQNDMYFEAKNEFGQTIPTDTHGDHSKGPTPKELILQGLCGCTAMDVLSILNKMRVPPKKFRVEAQTTLTEDHPRVFKDIHITYVVDEAVPEDKLKRAIELSQNQYCGVSAMLKKNSEIAWNIIREN